MKYRFRGGPLDGQDWDVTRDADGFLPYHICALQPMSLPVPTELTPAVSTPDVREPVTYTLGKLVTGEYVYTCRPEDLAEIFGSGSSGPPE
jgi:hypothetical protein